MQRGLSFQVSAHVVVLEGLHIIPTLCLCYLSAPELCPYNKPIIWQVNSFPEFYKLLYQIVKHKEKVMGTWFTACQSEAQETTWT